MGDRYRSGYRNDGPSYESRDQYEQYDRYGYRAQPDYGYPYESRGHPDRDRYYDSYSSRPNPRLPEPRHDRYAQYPPPPSLPTGAIRRASPSRFNGNEGEYTFKGAAARDDDRSARPQESFSFSAPGPRFPSPDRAYPPPPTGPRRREEARSRRGGAARGRGRGPRAAHTRDILHKAGRASTPEQLQGMNGHGRNRFGVIDMTGDSDEESDTNEVIDLTGDSDGENPRKRVKTQVQQSVAQSAPKWSNPDPYTVLPPPETLGAPKKDIVKTIRNAKAHETQQAEAENAVSGNADFISFDMDDDSDSKSVVNRNRSSSLTGSRNGTAVGGPRSRSSPFNSVNERAALPFHSDPGAPPPPPAGLAFPTDEELMGVSAGDGSGKKRKRAEQATGMKDVVVEWRSDGNDPTPWIRESSHFVDARLAYVIALPDIHRAELTTSFARLHREIVDFFHYVRPYSYEEDIRRDLVHRVQAAVRSFRGADSRTVEVKSFGSFACGLYLPVADMDLVAVTPTYLKRGEKIFCQKPGKIYNLARHLETSGLATPGTVTPVVHARVPIIKFVDRMTGIRVDISFENDSGLKANETFERWTTKHPGMSVIVMLVKQLLAMHGLNEVFNGGLGGFSIICLVTHMFEMMPEIQSGNMDPQQHFGEVFMTFLNLYGDSLDIYTTGLVMEPPSYYNKEKNPRPKQNMNHLTIIDPNNPNNDISGGSHNIRTVLDVFRTAAHTLQRKLYEVAKAPNQDHGSILGVILAGNYRSFEDIRLRLAAINRGEAVSPAIAPPSLPSARPQKRQRSQPRGEASLPPRPSFHGGRGGGRGGRGGRGRRGRG